VKKTIASRCVVRDVYGELSVRSGYREEQLAQKIIDANGWLNRGSALESNLLNAKSLENGAQGEGSGNPGRRCICT
jgi:hypothetical protein